MSTYVKRKVFGGPMDGLEIEVDTRAATLKFPKPAVYGFSYVIYFLWKDEQFHYEKETVKKDV